MDEREIWAGILRVEEWNATQRPADWKPVPRPPLGKPPAWLTALNIGEPASEPTTVEPSEPLRRDDGSEWIADPPETPSTEF